MRQAYGKTKRKTGGMTNYLSWFAKLIPDEVSEAISNRFIRGPIATVEYLADFVQTRSAFVAQTSLFGYLKERMGTSYQRYFEDAAFAESIRISQVRVYRACIADLAIFAAALVAERAGLKGADAERLAVHCYSYALTNSGADGSRFAPDAMERFQERAGRTIWPNAAIEENAFIESPPELIEAAPVIEQFKNWDREIVTNSIRFRWLDIRKQLRKRIAPEDIARDFQSAATLSE
jgi:hypothetical protein